MSKTKSNRGVLLWIIGVIAILAFLGVVYLLISNNYNSDNVKTILVGDVIAPTLEPALDDWGDSSPLAACSRADNRRCESDYGDTCRRSGYTGGGKCIAVYGSYEQRIVECDCYSHPV